MSDVKQVDVEIEIEVLVPVRCAVNVDLDELRAGRGLLDVFAIVKVDPVYREMKPADVSDAVDWDEFEEKLSASLAEYGIDVEELRAEAECDCGEECEGCEDCDCDEDEDDEDEGDDE